MEFATEDSQLLTLKRLLKFLVSLLIVLAVFDNVRNFLVISSYVTPLKEIVFLAIILLLIFSDQELHARKFMVIGIAPILIYLVLITPVAFSDYDLQLPNEGVAINPFALHYKTIQFFVGFLLMQSYFVRNTKYHDIVNFFVNLILFFIVFNIIAYFIPFPFFTKFRPYWGRVTTGYPTADGQTISLALICNLYIYNGKKVFTKVLINIVLIVGIIMQSTASGFATLGVILVYYFFWGKKGDLNRKANRLTLTGGALFISGIIAYIYTFFYTELEIVFQLIGKKMNFFLSMVGLNDSSYEADTDISITFREYHYDKVFQFRNDPLSLLFGGGTALGAYVENTFQFFQRAYGLVGLSIFLFFLACLCFHAIFINKNRVTRNIEICSLIALIIPCKAIIVPYTFSMMVFAFILAICFNNDKDSTAAHHLPD